MKHILLILLPLCLLSTTSFAQVFDLRCEGLQSPLGIETTTPHFSWKNTLTHNNQKQKAYEIQIASDSIALAKDHADIWKSGRVESDEQIMVAYTGTHLQERQLYYWRVRTWDENETCSGWSKIERFGVGILGNMNGQYIGCKQGNGLASIPMLTKRFNIKLQKGKTKVLAHINSLGYHELRINGTKVGDKILQPAVSQLDKHSLIVTYDITPYLRNGENEITIWLGQGWYRNNIFGVPFDGPLVKAEICEISSGTSKTIVQTDTSWQASPSGYSSTGTWMPLQFGGERFDANFQPQWQPATAYNVEGMRTSPQLFEGNCIIDSLQPKSVEKQDDGSLLIDFGRVITGWLQVSFGQLQKGEEVTMEYNDYIPIGGKFESQGESDIYIANGKSSESFCNKFHHHAFRYVKISNAELQDIKALQISALDVDKSATFSCSDEKLNAVHDLVKYTLQCLTFCGYMVDCPHLERMGYGGDGNSSTMTLQTIYDVLPTYLNWLTAWGESIDNDGSLAYVAPSFPTGGGPYWCGFIIKAPWRTYLNYGDRRMVDKLYEKMKLWLGFVEKHSKDELLQPWPDTKKRMWFLGDWLAPEGIDMGGESVIHANNCFISECLADMVKIANLLGRTDDAQKFTDKRKRLNSAIHKQFYHHETHSYANGTPFDNAYALLTGIAAENSVAQEVTKQLLADSYGKYKSHIAVGLFGLPIFTEWAIQTKQTDLMATILRQPDYPGYLYMIANGATATWESWGHERSRVHNCYNGIGTWFYQALAGIRPDESQPGYKHFFIDPQNADGISWVKTTKPTPFGDIRIEITATEMKITVPVGASATVYPSTNREKTFGAGDWVINK
ncbi:MAG: family 78 glycoside hydrolase catalytic domain [Bacteroidales bacterium]|nr:family 78 glycoside hydrolase catalytic domain [Bacteroidales bacterium]